VVLARAGPGDLREARYPDADEPAPATALLLLLAQLLVADLLEREVEGGAVVAGVVGEAGGGAVGELLRQDEVATPQLGGVHVELEGGGRHQPLDEVGGLGHAERAPVGDAPGRLVRIDAGGRDV